jgi:hypothetical protein
MRDAAGRYFRVQVLRGVRFTSFLDRNSASGYSRPRLFAATLLATTLQTRNTLHRRSLLRTFIISALQLYRNSGYKEVYLLDMIQLSDVFSTNMHAQH